MGSLIRLHYGQSNPLLGYRRRFFAEGGEGGAAAGGEGGQGGGAAADGAAGGGAPADFLWKGNLTPDVANSPTLKSLPDTREGLEKAMSGYLSLEKMLGGEKVPIPKGPDDKEGWSRFSKAMGIPDKADAYGLPDAEIPESMKGMTFDKQKFAETVHAFKLTPAQAKGLWGAYTEMVKQVYSNAAKAHQDHMTQVINQMRGEWGDAYDTNVELGNMVVNKFASDKDAVDFVMSTLAKDPRGIKFLSKIGSQFAENKIGEFSNQRFSLTPEQAQTEIDKILADPKDPYNDEKAPDVVRQRRIDYVNSLYQAKSRVG